MQIEIGPKLTIQEIEPVKKQIDASLKEYDSLRIITVNQIEEIDLTGVQLLIALHQSNSIELNIKIEEEQLQSLNHLGFSLDFIN